MLLGLLESLIKLFLIYLTIQTNVNGTRQSDLHDWECIDHSFDLNPHLLREIRTLSHITAEKRIK